MCEVFSLFKQKTAYEVRSSDWSSDVCSSDLPQAGGGSLIPLPQSPQPLRPPKHLPARNLLGEVHPLQPRPFPRLAQPRLDIELALRVMRDHPIGRPDRKSVVQGKSVSVSDELGGRRTPNKKPTTTLTQ